MSTHIKQLIDEFLRKSRMKGDYKNQIEKTVDGFLGKETRKHIWVKKIIGGRLVFNSDSSSSIYNFSLKKEELLKELKKKHPEIKKIEIRIGEK